MLNNIFHCFLSFILFYAIAFIMSENRKAINIKITLQGVALQIIFAFALLQIPSIALAFQQIGKVFEAIAHATNAAASVIFGKLVDPSGYILAIQGLPVLIVVGALSGALMYWRILPSIIKIISPIYRKIFSIGGTLGTAASVNLFSGMNETPLILRSYLRHLTHSELFTIMVCGMAGISTSLMALYSMVLGNIVENAIVHVINAALISIPGALTLARIVIPETDSAHLSEAKNIEFSTAQNTLDAISDGIMNGGKIVLKVIAILIGFIALVDIANQLLELINPELTLQKILGWMMAPIVWIIGIPWKESVEIGSLLGIKFILNEVVAFSNMVDMAQIMSEKSKIVSIYLLANFANIGSVGVITGVYVGLVPERKNEIVKIGLKAMIIANLATFLTCSLANVALG